MRARLSAPIQTGPRSLLASYSMGTTSFLRVKLPRRRPPTSHLTPKNRAIPLPPFWDSVACSRVNFTFTLTKYSCWGNLREGDHWGGPDADGRIILRWIFRKWKGVVRTGWSWLRIGIGGGHL